MHLHCFVTSERRHWRLVHISRPNYDKSLYYYVALGSSFCRWSVVKSQPPLYATRLRAAIFLVLKIIFSGLCFFYIIG